MKKKYFIKKKKYKSFNLLINSKKELLIKASFLIIPVELKEVISFIDYTKDNKFRLFFLVKKNPIIFLKKFKKQLIGIFGGWFIVLSLVGRGFTFLNFDRYIKFNLGYSHGIGFFLPNNVYILSILNKKNDFYIFSYDLDQMLNIAFFFRKLKKLDSYKGKGVKFENEIVKLKAGKKNQI